VNRLSCSQHRCKLINLKIIGLILSKARHLVGRFNLLTPMRSTYSVEQTTGRAANDGFGGEKEKFALIVSSVEIRKITYSGDGCAT
jgi:hypothetical protein